MEFTERLSISELNRKKNKYEKLLSCFTNMCCILESETRNKKRSVDAETDINILYEKVDEHLSNLYTTMTTAIQDMLLTGSWPPKRIAGAENDSLHIPYGIQSNLVDSVKKISGIDLPSDEVAKEKLITNSKGEGTSTLRKTIESNIGDLENSESLH